MGGRQLLTFFDGCCLADLLKIEHRKHLQNLLLLRSFFQKALLDHPRQVRRGQFLESSPQCSLLAQNTPPEVRDHDCSSHLPLAHPFYPDSSSHPGIPEAPRRQRWWDAGCDCQGRPLPPERASLAEQASQCRQAELSKTQLRIFETLDPADPEANSRAFQFCDPESSFWLSQLGGGLWCLQLKEPRCLILVQHLGYIRAP